MLRLLSVFGTENAQKSSLALDQLMGIRILPNTLCHLIVRFPLGSIRFIQHRVALEVFCVCFNGISFHFDSITFEGFSIDNNAAFTVVVVRHFLQIVIFLLQCLEGIRLVSF